MSQVTEAKSAVVAAVATDVAKAKTAWQKYGPVVTHVVTAAVSLFLGHKL